MPSIETLQAKRVALVDSQTQLIGQINRVGGAIAVIDELINEEQASQAAAAKAEAETATAWAEKVAGIRKSMEAHPCPPPPPANWTPPAPCGGNTAQQMADEVKATPPEMIPLSKFEPCDDCSTTDDCEFVDTCRASAAVYTANESDPA